jgi:tRNA-dihydrouridine synthase B
VSDIKQARRDERAASWKACTSARSCGYNPLPLAAIASIPTVHIGPHVLPNALAVAPMAGVTDRPFRQLCRRFGAGYAVSEMVASDPRLRGTDKSRRRTDHDGEPSPIAVQIAGADPAMMAEAARYNVERGAQIIDINMGCPAKKVCNAAAGSALLSNEPLVAAIVAAVVNAVDVPVTLKIRTGPDRGHRNAVRIARLAEDAGVAALTVHGRSRACMFVGPVDYEAIAEVKRSVSIPVIANGDIASPRTAREVFALTGADALMIGRAAQGRPWIFREIAHFLATGTELAAPTVAEAAQAIVAHLDDHYAFYGEEAGVRIARKHLHWYTRDLDGADEARSEFNVAETTAAQRAAVVRLFDRLAQRGERLLYANRNGSTIEARERFASRQAARETKAATPGGGEALAA